MTRDFSTQSLSKEIIISILKDSLNAPSAGFSQGVSYLVLFEKQDVDDFWQITSQENWRKSSDLAEGLMNAPVVILPMVSELSYRQRYSSYPKSGSYDISTPYWYVDGGMSVMLALLRIEEEGLGALFIRIRENEDVLCKRFNFDASTYRPIGAILLGYPRDRSKFRGSQNYISRKDPFSQIKFSKFC